MNTEVEPTLDDKGVMDFISKGYVIVEGLGSDALHQQCRELKRGGLDEFVQSEMFTREVLLHPSVAGVARSLLGRDFLVPKGAHHHLYEEPHPGQTWHSDGISHRGHGVTHLQCYYYPDSVGPEDGPTMVLPGSHHRVIDREAIAHYQNIHGQVSLTVPAGTLVMGHYTLWHRAGPKLNSRRRGMIKFSYFRTTAPIRDWKTDPEAAPPHHFPRQYYASEIEFYRDSVRGRRMWEWLSGDADDWNAEPGKTRLFTRSRSLNEALASIGASS